MSIPPTPDGNFSRTDLARKLRDPSILSELEANELRATGGDPAIVEISRQIKWPANFEEHSLRTLTMPERRALVRAILFLRTDLPYEWPRREVGTPLPALAGADAEVWPFFRRADYRAYLGRGRA